MKTKIQEIIDFDKINHLLEGFYKTTGFLTAILDLEGNVLSKSGWRQICTHFHREHPETARRCLISDTELSNKMAEGSSFHHYKCLNGLVDVAVPIIVKGEHIANLFTGQFFFEKPNIYFFREQAKKYKFDEEKYIGALQDVPVVSKEKVKAAMDFLLDVTQLISEMALRKQEQIELNEAIIASEERFRSIFENSLAIMLLIDPATYQIIDANHAAERFYGWNHAQLTQMTIGQINTLPTEELQQEMENAMAQKRVYFKFKHRLANKSVRNVEVYSSKVEIEGKDYLHSIVHDVSEQVEAEVALRKSEERFRVAQDFSPDGFTILHPLRNEKDEVIDFTWVYENQTIARINKTNPQDVVGKHLLDLFPIHKGTPVFDAYIDVANSRKPIILEEIYVGEVISIPTWLRLVIVPMEDDIAILAQDITERKKSEEKILQNEARLQSLVNIFQHRAENVQDFLDFALSEAIKLTGSQIGYIYFYSEEKNEFTLNTWSNGVMDLCSVTEPQTVYQLEKTGIWGEAVRQRKEIIVNDFIAPNPLKKGLPEGHAQLFRYLTIPVFSNNKIVAVLGLANKKTDYEKYDVLQLQLLMDALWKEVERKRGEQFLMESEERFRTIVECAPDPIFIQINHKFAYLNQPALQLFGASTEAEMLDKRVLDFVHPDYREKALKRIRIINEQKESILTLLEQKFIRLNGEEVWVETTGEPIFFNGINGGLVFVRDISERKKSEQQLLHTHNLMKYIIEHDRNAIAIHDKNLNYIYVSQRYLDEYKVNDRDVIGKHHYDVFPEVPEKWKEVHRRALNGEILNAEEDFFIRPDGSTDWTRWECRPWYEADGSVGGIIIYSELINERKNRENEIKSLNKRLDILIKAVQKLAAAKTIEEVQSEVVKSARELIGADGATVVFREDNNCFYACEDAISPLWQGKRFPLQSCVSGWVMENKKALVIEDIYADSRVPIEAYRPTFVKSLAMVPININEPFGAIGNYWKDQYHPTPIELNLLQTLADSAARALENIRLLTELEQKVAERTASLESVNKELETFTYSVSHDLKAPLRGIDGYSMLLHDLYGNILNDEAKHFVSTIRSSTLQMNQLIDDLLQYSRLERNQLRIEPLRLIPLLDAILHVNKVEIEQYHFNIQLPETDHELMADSGAMQIVLRNLIENAIKFSKSVPNPAITIALEEQADSWVLSVKDKGVGFDMKYSQRIFEIFQRLHRAEDYPGTGIGLAMVAKAVQRMNGKVWAESQPGEGASFYVEIPKQK